MTCTTPITRRYKVCVREIHEILRDYIVEVNSADIEPFDGEITDSDFERLAEDYALEDKNVVLNSFVKSLGVTDVELEGDPVEVPID